MSQYDSKSKISTLGPLYSNSYFATKFFMEKHNITGEPILRDNFEESFELLLNKTVDLSVVCNLFPDMFELYIPNIRLVNLCDSIIHGAHMGFYTRDDVTNINTVAVTIPASKFLPVGAYEIVQTPSNSEAAVICKAGNADGAVTTDKAAKDNNLKMIEDYGVFSVSYSVFCRKNSEKQ